MSEKNKILITTSIMLSLMGTGYYSEIPVKPVMAQTMVAEKTPGKIYETEEWKSIKEKWDNMNRVNVSDFEDIYKIIQEEKKEMEELCKPLIKKGLLSSVSADAINLIYCENLRSTLEKKVELPMCYKTSGPSEWDVTGIDNREQLNKKLVLLEDCYKKGSIKKDIYDKVKIDIGNRLDLLSKADKYWKAIGEGKCEKHPKEVDVLLHLYDCNVGKIKEGKDVSTDLVKSSEYIVKLEK